MTALDRLLPLADDESRQLARHHLRRERDGHTLQRTAWFMQPTFAWGVRAKFSGHRARTFGWASSLTRHVLVDHTRARPAAKRGGGQAEPPNEPSNFRAAVGLGKPGI